MSDRRNAAAMAADTTRATGAYLTRAEIDHLADELAKLPGLEAELAVAVTGMRRGGPVRRSVPRSKPPYSIEMQSLIDDLRNTLVAVIRDLCEQRALDYDGSSSISGMGKWLTRNRYGLQLIESGAESFHDLCEIITRCERAMAWSTDPPLAPAEKHAARGAFVTATTIEIVARRVGVYGLTEDRLRYLARKGRIRASNRPGNTDARVYLLGDVLDAHNATPTRGGA